MKLSVLIVLLTFPVNVYGNVSNSNEIALILPVQYSSWRYASPYDPFQDHQSNIYNRYHPHTDDINTYYSLYFVLKTTAFCNYKYFHLKHQLVCVECQSFSRHTRKANICKGQGQYLFKSKFSNVLDSKCMGDWIQLTRMRMDTCNRTHMGSFTFV